MFVKICGVRTATDVAAVVESGADAVGFVLTESPRQVTAEQARELAAELPPDVLSVGVCRGVPVDWVRTTVMAAGLHAIQLHGDYSPADFAACADLPVRLIRGVAGHSTADHYCGSHGEEILLLDAPAPGSGKPWDWTNLAAEPPLGQWMLAGGLHPGNVAEAISMIRPWGVDVSSGVETSRGVKDPALIVDFVRAAREASR
ncbi:N-(5'-phosphoribosyl)anthranilate isomerase [Longimycelium tulufanense]|uniref:N-(5'-phosphoribosyl)anthranilate isomerase n=1 Tax=Longimycelium tulufanense TaxID=907463 RepID=A0A8J3C787_9PSEU|nr:phosphoribosylanthranilate isomerase [Longimycelium tulufanense]GGM47110.1 N-(5'-phosphoribosyl)anthranilate isomerase [Longimycelium tulufanense]